jgi:hypothetical protein
MKGIVFTKFIEMVEEKFSVDMAEEMIEASHLPNGGSYTSVGTYDHQEMVTLLVQLSKITGVPAPELLRSYGNFLFGQFAQLYAVFFVGITSSLAFAGQIDEVNGVKAVEMIAAGDYDLRREISETCLLGPQR